MDVLEWPVKSLDLNIIDNVCGQLARTVYEDGRQDETVAELEIQ